MPAYGRQSPVSSPRPSQGRRAGVAAAPSGHTARKSHQPQPGPGLGGNTSPARRLRPRGAPRGALPGHAAVPVALVGRRALSRDVLGPAQMPVQRGLRVLPGVHRARWAGDAARPGGRAGAAPARRRPRTAPAAATPGRRRCSAGGGRSCSPRRPARGRRPADRRSSSRSIRPENAIRSVRAPTVRSTPAGSSAGSRPATYFSTMPRARSRAAADCASLANPSLIQPRSSKPAGGGHGPLRPAAAATIRPARCARWRRGCCAPRAAPCAGRAGPGSSSGTRRRQSSQVLSRVGVHAYRRRGIPSSPSCSSRGIRSVRVRRASGAGPAVTHESNCFWAADTVVSSPCPGSTRVGPGRVSRCSPMALSCAGKSGYS